MKNDRKSGSRSLSFNKWKGFFFPYPTYGGVMVNRCWRSRPIRLNLERMDHWQRTVIFSRSEAKKLSLLKSQNTLAKRFLRVQAQSLQFFREDLRSFNLGIWNQPLKFQSYLQRPKISNPNVTDFDFSGNENRSLIHGLYIWFGPRTDRWWAQPV